MLSLTLELSITIITFFKPSSNVTKREVRSVSRQTSEWDAKRWSPPDDLFVAALLYTLCSSNRSTFAVLPVMPSSEINRDTKGFFLQLFQLTKKLPLILRKKKDYPHRCIFKIYLTMGFQWRCYGFIPAPCCPVSVRPGCFACLYFPLNDYPKYYLRFCCILVNSADTLKSQASSLSPYFFFRFSFISHQFQ